MSHHTFEEIAPGINAEIFVHKDNQVTKSIDIHIKNIFSNIDHLFTLVQKMEGVHLLDESKNTICELKNTSIQGSIDTLTSFIQIIISTCVSTMNTSYLKVQNEFIAKPCLQFHKPKGIEPMAFSGFNPQQIQKTYNVPLGSINGLPKPIITIVIAYTYDRLQADFDIFCKKFALPPSKLKIATLGTEKNSGWAGEECLDVQWLHAMNPYAIIQVVEAKSSSFKDMFDAVSYASNPPPGSPVKKPDIISMSWGALEGQAQAYYEKYFSERSICYLASSGDAISVNYPSTSPHVLSCGGTSLYLNSNGGRLNEMTWQSAGTGLSSVFPKPKYQNKMTALNPYSNRAIADISGVANPQTGVLYVYNGSTSVVGGTSVSCPVIAGLLSYAVSKRKSVNKPPLTTVESAPNNIHSILYNLTKDPVLYAKNYYDITQGKNGPFSADKNYDMPTGCGALNCVEITNTLANI